MTPAEPRLCTQSHDRNAAIPTETLFISVIMPVRNEAKLIERTLGQLVTQNYDSDRFEIIVVDGQSTDGTPERVAKFAEQHRNVHLYTNPRRLGSAARNVALHHAQGDVVVIVDGHCELEDDRYLAKLASAFDRSGADCIGRPQPLDVPAATALQRAIAAARSSRLGHHPDSYIYSSSEGFVPAHSVAVAYRRSIFEQVGTFDEHFDACEDVEMNHRIDRAGLRCFFTPDAAVHYAPRNSLSGLFRQLVRYGRGRVRLARKHPETLSLGILPPPLFVAGLIAGLPLSFVARWLAMIYLAAVVVYVAVVLTVSATIVWRLRSPRLCCWLPLVFLTIHAASGAGMLRELIKPARQPSNARHRHGAQP
jgi:succinoglycan biosynthesis protein ExoA